MNSVIVFPRYGRDAAAVITLGGTGDFVPYGR
jgi:hypothetical protein